jgi:hypothetical protein
VDHWVDGCTIALWVEGSDEGRWLRPHRGEERFDRVQYAGDAAKRERRGAESDDLAVLRRPVASDDVNWIGRRINVIECPVQILETRGELAAAGATSGTA